MKNSITNASANLRYPATLSPQDGGYFVQFVDLPDTFTEGATVDEALFNAAEVLSAMLGWRSDEGQAIPSPSENVADAYYITPDTKTQAVLLLRQARGERSLADLARALDTSWAQVKRLDDARHWASLKTLDKAAKVLGKRLELRFV